MTSTGARPSVADSDDNIRALYPDRLDIDEDDRFNLRMGVYYPAGYAVLAIAGDAVQASVQGALDSGIPIEALTLLRPVQMQQIVARSREKAGLAAKLVGAELKQLDVFEQLSEDGHHFLLVRDDDSTRPAILDLGMRIRAAKGLLYHSLAAEDLAVPHETIPGDSPFGANEVARSYPSDAGPQLTSPSQSGAGVDAASDSASEAASAEARDVGDGRGSDVDPVADDAPRR